MCQSTSLFIYYFWGKECDMIVYNELSIAKDKMSLIVDCAVNSDETYAGITITSVDVVWYGNYSSSGYDTNKAFTKEVDATSARLQFFIDKAPEKFGVTTFDKGLFYVIVHYDGDSSAIARVTADLPCSEQTLTEVAIVPDWEYLYANGMPLVARFASNCGKNCDEPDALKNFILFWNAFKLAASTCDVEVLKDLWDRVNKRGFAGVTCGCGCK